MKVLTAILVTGIFLSFGMEVKVSEQELKEDRELLKEINSRLDKLDKRVNAGDTSAQVINELNSFGYPLYVLRQKYLDYNEPRYGKYHDTYFMTLDTQEKLFFIKRGILPGLVRKEAETQKLPVCDVEIKGKDRKTLLIRMKNPTSDEEIKRIIDNTQIKYAHIIGVETVSFDKCK